MANIVQVLIDELQELWLLQVSNLRRDAVEDVLSLTHVFHLHFTGVSNCDFDSLIEYGVRDLLHTNKLLDNSENDDLYLGAC